MKHFIASFLILTVFAVHTFAGEKEVIAAMKKGDYQTAYKEALPLAEKGDTEAMMTIGLLYHRGEGFKQDYVKAMDWYLKAFKKRKGDAFNNIGVMYRDGLGVDKNLEIAYALFWITYWGGLGSDDTQIRVGGNINKIVAMMKPEEIEQAIKMTGEYVIAYVEKRGKLNEKEKALKYAKDHPAIEEMAKMDASDKPSKSYNFVYELRAPKILKLDPLMSIDLVTEQGSSGTRLKFMKQREDGDFIILRESTLIFSEERRALVLKPENEADQVFRLSIPSKPKPQDWSNWKRPDYIEKTDASWTFMHDLKKHDRSNKIPTNCFELRYKIEESK
jgi:hypothetical protein